MFRTIRPKWRNMSSSTYRRIRARLADKTRRATQTKRNGDITQDIRARLEQTLVKLNTENRMILDVFPALSLQNIDRLNASDRARLLNAISAREQRRASETRRSRCKWRRPPAA